MGEGLKANTKSAILPIQALRRSANQGHETAELVIGIVGSRAGFRWY